MKQLLLILLLSTAFFSAKSQEINLDDLHENQVKFTNKSMSILGGWALVNITGGLVMRENSEGINRKFWEGNALWNSVNLGLAGASLLANQKGKSAGTIGDYLKTEQTLQKAFIFNAGLDLAYMAAGWGMTERGKRMEGEKAMQLRGYGKALILQGGFLFLFDGVCYGLRTANIQTLYDNLDVNISLGLVGNMATLRATF
ncbi:MAG: hypothetical protein ACJATA_000030 [Sphingobacteriales bacterium]|jgi:hypothetical protein